MSLLQIGGGTRKKCGGRVVGIDLGTTYSLVARVVDGTPGAITDEDDDPRLASVVWFGEHGQIEVGEHDPTRPHAEPGVTIRSVKRFMGRAQREASRANELNPYPFERDSDGPVVHFRLCGGKRVTAIEVSAEILRVLRDRAETALGGPLDGAVITVPAYFDDAQRQATKDAARIAGISVLRLLNEPTAAALAYGLDKKSRGVFAVFDLGGGTFDISILRLEAGVFQVLATGGDSRLGGDDFDRAIAEHFLRESGVDPASASTEVAARALWIARAAKERLTDCQETELFLEGHRHRLSRELFRKLIEPTMRRLFPPIRRVLADCGIEGPDLDGVVLVGGSTRVPDVRAFVEERFGKKPLADLDPDQVVALGAAVQADLLAGSGPRDDVLLLDVLPLSLGVETMGGGAEKILHRNQTIPATAEQEFTTYADGQTGMTFHVVQGERELVADCRSLARFELGGIPPMGAGLARVIVTFSVDADGILHVAAEEKTTKRTASVQVKPSYGLDDATVERMIRDAYEHARDDVDRRLFVEARVDAERMLAALEKALAQDAALVGPAELEVFRRAMDELGAATRGTNYRAVRECSERLDAITAEFAVRRMNRSIGEALAGRKAEEVGA